MSGKTLKEIEEFVSGTVVTKVYLENNDYPYYFLGETLMGWAEYLDTNNFDPFGLLGFTVQGYRVEVAAAYYAKNGYAIDSTIFRIIQTKGLTDAISEISAMGPHVSVEKF